MTNPEDKRIEHFPENHIRPVRSFLQNSREHYFDIFITALRTPQADTEEEEVREVEEEVEEGLEG